MYDILDGAMQISYTRINTYQRCPHKYQLAYVERIPVAKRGELLLGSAVHGALKFMHDPRPPQLPSQEEVIGEFCRLWREYQESLPEKEHAALFESGVDMLRRYHERESVCREPRFTASVERLFTLPLENSNRITGRIDRVDVLDNGIIEVLDYKTGRTMPTQVEVDNDLQLAIYQMAAENLLYPDKTVTTSLYYLRHGVTFTASFSPQQMEEKRAEIMEVIEKIAREEFSPRVGNQCDFCEYRAYCCIFRPVSVSEEERADIEAMIRELAEVENGLGTSRAEMKHYSGRKAELEAGILDWMKRAGTGFYAVGNLQALAGVSRRTTYPAEAVKEILQPLGLWEKVREEKVTKKAIDDLCRSGNLPPALKRQLLSLAEMVEKPIVKLRRLEDETEEAEE
jgi:putative RecB family exonuclease